MSAVKMPSGPPSGPKPYFCSWDEAKGHFAALEIRGPGRRGRLGTPSGGFMAGFWGGGGVGGVSRRRFLSRGRRGGGFR